ncbi:MAG TPA: LON peptidase substrate-binding domain-containing protein [Acidimicrobiales bacterium]|nr:LON peptidase substrate-binding domain-containing protein [Acidimicrobiales bacterium]
MAGRPMFPLGSVLLPGMVLPLHVFEERYRALMRDCMAGDRRFGVTLIERGSEVGGGDIRAMAGCLAEIVQADELPDGRWGIVAVGTERIRVTGWLPDDPYPIAEVEDWPDVPSADPEAAVASYEARVAQLRRVLAMAVELGAEADPMVLLADDAEIGSYQIGVLSPIGPLDRQRLLTASGVDERLALLEELLDDQELMIRSRLEDG